MGEEEEDGRGQNRPGAPQLLGVTDRRLRIHLRHVAPVRLVDLKSRPVPEVEEPRDRHEGDQGDRSEVDDELVEAEVGGPGDDDVRRVPDQRRRSTDVRRDHLDHDQRNRIDVERIRDEEGHRDDQEDRRQVVEEGGEERGRRGEAEDQVEGAPAGGLAGADRDVVVESRLLGEIDEDHHPREQADRVEVDRLDRLVLRELVDEQHHDRRAEQGDLRAVNPLGCDRPEDDQEGPDRDRHVRCGQPAPRSEHCWPRPLPWVDDEHADQPSRRTWRQDKDRGAAGWRKALGPRWARAEADSGIQASLRRSRG
ncbi:MAG TPA: hypothetical protein VHH72_09315 [Solirubrobacterales bacterium]|nr:hypothetical protein [Solirubrobacterales bacterium]